MSKLPDLQCADRIAIFRSIAVNDLDEVCAEILDHIADGEFQTFLDFCDQVYQEKDIIKSISCEISDGSLHFQIEYK